MVELRKRKSSLLMLDFDDTLCSRNSVGLLDPGEISDPVFRAEVKKFRESLLAGDMASAGYVGLSYLKLLRFHKNDLQRVGEDIPKRFISEDKFLFVEEVKKDFDVIIVTGSVKELVSPSAEKFGVDFFCVELEYNDDGYFADVKANGFEVDKHVGISANIDISPYDVVVMVGDGENDYRVWQSGLCTHYICYTEYREAGFSKNIQEKKASNIVQLKAHLSDISVK